jgi:hypothetical protein
VLRISEKIKISPPSRPSRLARKQISRNLGEK